MLATHQQQFNWLTSLTKEMVRALQGLRLQAPKAQAPPPSPPSQAPAPSSFTASPRLVFPEKFDGSPTKCNDFLLQCSMFVKQQPMLYPTDNSRIAFVCSLLTGRALEWATVVLSEDHSVFPSFSAFILWFKEVFEHPTGGKEAGEQLLSLRQGRGSVADYALSFHTLAAQTGLPGWSSQTTLLQGFESRTTVWTSLSGWGRSLDQFIELAIRIDNLLRSRHQTRFSSAPLYHLLTPNPCRSVSLISAKRKERDSFAKICADTVDDLDTGELPVPLIHHAIPLRWVWIFILPLY